MVGEAGADVSGGPRGSAAGFIPHPAPAGGLFDGLTSLDVGVFEEIGVPIERGKRRCSVELPVECRKEAGLGEVEDGRAKVWRIESHRCSSEL
jgi:hypothetical protein